MKVSAIQLTPGADVERNTDNALALISEAAGEGASFVTLPEYFLFYGDETKWIEVAERTGSILERFKEKAQEHDIHILAGTMLFPASGGKLLNASALIGRDGVIKARYAKRNLFDVDLDHRCYRESDVLSPGDEMVTAAVEEWTLGFSICFDLRFPDHYQTLRKMGAQVIVAPSAFSLETGSAHWMPLVRARAIETQCYVIAPALEGETSPEHKCFGSTAIIDPWGEVLGLRDKGEGIVTAELDMERVDEVRRKIPLM